MAIMKLPGRRKYILKTRLTPAACAARLTRLVEGWRNPFDPEPNTPAVAGHVSSNGFYIRKRILYRNGAQPDAAGRFVPEGGATRIIVDIGISPWIYAGAIFIYTFVVGFVVLVVASSLTGASSARGDPMAALLVLGVIAIAPAVLFLVGRRLATGEETFLLELITDELEARQLGDGRAER
jgi:hypothetical protein